MDLVTVSNPFALTHSHKPAQSHTLAISLRGIYNLLIRAIATMLFARVFDQRYVRRATKWPGSSVWLCTRHAYGSTSAATSSSSPQIFFIQCIYAHTEIHTHTVSVETGFSIHSTSSPICLYSPRSQQHTL